MSDAVVFATGGVLFLITTGATIAYLLSRFMAAYNRQLLESESVERIEADRFTELYVTARTDASQPSEGDRSYQPAGSSLEPADVGRFE